MIIRIETQQDYAEALAVIETLLTKAGPPGGSPNKTESDFEELQRLSLLVERYEDKHYPMPVEPATLLKTGRQAE